MSNDLLDDLWLAFLPVKKAAVKDVKNGTIVRYQGDWGVLEGRWLMCWIGDPIKLAATDRVEVLEKKK